MRLKEKWKGEKVTRKMKAGAIKQIAIKRLSEVKNLHYPLSSILFPLFTIRYLLNSWRLNGKTVDKI